MDTNYIALDLPRPHFLVVLIYYKPVINLYNYIVKFVGKKVFFPLLFLVHSLKYMVSKKGKKIDFMLLSVTDRSRLSNWILAVKKLRIAKIDKNSSGYTRLRLN